MPLDRSNLCVRAFEWLRPADEIAFRIRSEIPLAAGLGSSAAAIVAGLLAADHLYELALEREDLLTHAAEIEGHPDNVAAALYGGFVVCSRQDGAVTATRLEPPRGSRGCVVIPAEQVPTEQAREAIPGKVPIDDAVANVAAASELVLGIQRSDLTLIGRGLADRLHQPHRAHLYPRSMEIVADAPQAGRDRRDHLRRRPHRPRLVLLAEHRQGRRGAPQAGRRLGGGPPRPLLGTGRRRPGALAIGLWALRR